MSGCEAQLDEALIAVQSFPILDLLSCGIMFLIRPWRHLPVRSPLFNRAEIMNAVATGDTSESWKLEWNSLGAERRDALRAGEVRGGEGSGLTSVAGLGWRRGERVKWRESCGGADEGGGGSSRFELGPGAIYLVIMSVCLQGRVRRLSPATEREGGGSEEHAEGRGCKASATLYQTLNK